MAINDYKTDKEAYLQKSLKEVKKDLKDAYEDGCICPCCHQHVQLYKRKLNSGMAITLLRMYKHFKVGAYYHVKDFLKEIF